MITAFTNQVSGQPGAASRLPDGRNDQKPEKPGHSRLCSGGVDEGQPHTSRGVAARAFVNSTEPPALKRAEATVEFLDDFLQIGFRLGRRSSKGFEGSVCVDRQRPDYLFRCRAEKALCVKVMRTVKG